MVCLLSSVSVCNNPVHLFPPMAGSGNTAQRPQTRKPSPGSSNCPKPPPCHGSRWAAIDVVILIAVIGAIGFLLYPYAEFISVWLVGIVGAIAYMVREEVCEETLIYGCLGIGVSCSAFLATWGLVTCFTGQKCGDPRCRGLREAAELDVRPETEDSLKYPSSTNEGSRKGLLELPRDHHRGLEAELKKIALPNGQAVLLFRARCGCSVGRMVVPDREE